jgi:hypothetical protein
MLITVLLILILLAVIWPKLVAYILIIGVQLVCAAVILFVAVAMLHDVGIINY